MHCTKHFCVSALLLLMDKKKHFKAHSKKLVRKALTAIRRLESTSETLISAPIFQVIQVIRTVPAEWTHLAPAKQADPGGGGSAVHMFTLFTLFTVTVVSVFTLPRPFPPSLSFLMLSLTLPLPFPPSLSRFSCCRSLVC